MIDFPALTPSRILVFGVCYIIVVIWPLKVLEHTTLYVFKSVFSILAHVLIAGVHFPNPK
jgi:hypothetical protein